MRYIGVDIESIGLKPYGGTIWMLSVTEKKKTKVYHNCNGLKRSDIPPSVIRDLEDPDVCKIMHSGQHDVPYLVLNLKLKGIPNIWDTELTETVILGMRFSTPRKIIEAGSWLEKQLKKFSTQALYVWQRYGFPAPDKETRDEFIDRPLGRPFTKRPINYAADDTRPLPFIMAVQEKWLTDNEELEVALLENKVSERYHDMKIRGIGFDKKLWAMIADKSSIEFARRMKALPKDVSNWNSPAQVKTYFKKKGILIESYDDLDEVYLQTRNKTLGDFIFARELHKAVTAYGHNWFTEGFIDGDGRVRCDVTQIINTGRNSMSNPNLQQLPGKGNTDYFHRLTMDIIRKQQGADKMKWLHRRAFIPKPGHVFVIGDFSGQEIGIMAAMSDEKLWIDALLRGEDIHGLTASLINRNEWQRAASKGCTFPKKCTCPGHLELREPAKINNFMLAYGGGAGKFAKNTGTDQTTAIAYVAAHKRVIPRLTATLEKNGRDALATGLSYSADPYRRRRVLMGEENWQVVNQGKNNPVQSAGANMLKLAMVSLPWEFPIVLVIHDEIICEVPIKQAEKCMKALKQVMEKSADYITGIAGLVKVEPKVSLNLMKEEKAKLIKGVWVQQV